MAHFPDHMNPTEARITNKILTAALNQGWHVRVYDGEEFATPVTRDRAAIQREVAATCETYLHFAIPHPEHAGKWLRMGWVWLVHGNGEDVFADYGAPDESRLAILDSVFKGIGD